MALLSSTGRSPLLGASSAHASGSLLCTEKTPENNFRLTIDTEPLSCILLHMKNGNSNGSKKMSEEINELRNEISNCNAAIKAYRMGLRHLAPEGMGCATYQEWFVMQKNYCVRRLTELKALAD
jgi:hypothetical protein